MKIEITEAMWLDERHELTLAELAELSGLSAEELRQLVECEALLPTNPAAAEAHKKLASCIYLGNMVSHFMGYGFGYQSLALKGRVEAVQALNLNEDSLPRFMIQVQEEFASVEALLAVAG